jgi:hypothetical protein
MLSNYVYPLSTIYRLKRGDAGDRRGSKAPVVSSLEEARQLAWAEHGPAIEAALADLTEQGWQAVGVPGPDGIEARQFSRSVLADALQSSATTMLFGCALSVALTAASGGTFLLVLAGLVLTQNDYVEVTEFRTAICRE